MNETCFSCGSNAWEKIAEYVDFEGNAMETYRCINCSHLQTKKVKTKLDDYEEL